MFSQSKRRQRWISTASALSLALLLGCSHNDKQPQVASVDRTLPGTPAPQPPAPEPNVSSNGNLNISERVRQGCNLPDEPEDSPQFDYDDAGLRDRGRRILNGVAECMTNGALKGEPLTIVGHADPRGTVDYNQDLGMQRAEAARDYLLSRGVPLARMTIESRGERDATGTDESSWQLDRRIDIDQGSGASMPTAQR